MGSAGREGAADVEGVWKGYGWNSALTGASAGDWVDHVLLILPYRNATPWRPRTTKEESWLGQIILT